MTADPTRTGLRVLAALAAGRKRAIERARVRGAATAMRVRRAVDIDILEGRAPRGRPGRIARRLRREGMAISERQVHKILERLSSGSDSVRSNPYSMNTGAPTE